ncbi:hypothetical protein C8Q77DRAFT_916004 [Trametes polyzona]|nr:hypothetical protein C8Q77DRAFT_916004 [Trametes polyzona]
MPPRATAYSVKLHPNSLYITTIPLISNSFHWALIHVDDKGVATRHQWIPTTSNPTGPEGYVEQAMPRGPTSKVENGQVLAYFRISDYTSVGVAELRTTCSSVFPKSYHTAQENRRADITCRTWVTHILGRLITPGRAQEIEALVKKHSTTCSNTFASDFLFQRVYEVQVFTL